MPVINDILEDAIIYHSAVDLMKIEAGQRSEVKKMMKELEKELIKEMATADITGVQRTSFQKERLKALLKQTKETTRTYMDSYAETAHNNLYDLAEAEVLFTETMFNNAYKVPLVSVALSPSRLKAIAGKTLVEGDFPKQWWGKQTIALQGAFTRQMRMGMLRSETIGQLAKRIRDNVIPTSRRNALALVRTSSMAVIQEARKESYKQVDDVLKGYKFVATLDSRTTKICMSCDGAVFNLDYKVRKGPKFCKPPPLHWSCFIDPQIPIYTETGWKKIGNIQVGDKVLTHKGRFKKVTELLFRKKQSPVIYTLHFSNLRKGKKITVTEGHPIEVERNNKKVWVPVENIKMGDQISYLGNRCECGKMIPFYLKWCSLSCKSKHTGGNWAKDPVKRKEIKSPKRLKRRLSRIFNNHEGNYEFMSVIVSDIKKWTAQRSKTLYNFSVEDDESYIAQGFVVHNCRSTLSPITKSWNELERQYNGTSKMKDFDKIPAGTRASMDGQVPVDVNYTKWLKGKSKTFQNEVLGPTRAKLFREGKITNMSNLLDQSGNPLTIPDLKKAIEKSALVNPINRKLILPDLSDKGAKLAQTIAREKERVLQDAKMAELKTAPSLKAPPIETQAIKDAKIAELKTAPSLNVTPTEIQAIKDAKGNGIVLRTDKDQIEDADILFFPETGTDGKEITSAVFKVRGENTIDITGWESTCGTFNAKTIEKGGLTQTGKQIDIGVKPYFQKDFDGVTVKYWNNTSASSLALRGRVEITAYKSPDTGVEDIYKVLGKLGIDNKRITPEYEEELYLLQLLYGFNKPTRFSKVMDTLGFMDTPIDRVIFLKKSYNTWVGRKVTDSPEYNPSGTYQAFKHGHKLNIRPDLASDPNWEKFSDEYMLHHKFYGKGLVTLKNIVNSGGNLISTTDKLRRGMRCSGSSPISDIESGGASYAFTRIWRKGRAKDIEGIVWKTNALKRADAISYPTDYYGEVTNKVIEKGLHDQGGRVNSVKAFIKISNAYADNETLFKNSLSIYDDVDYIKIFDKDYDEAVRFLKEEIGDHFPDGRAVEDVLFRIVANSEPELKLDSDGNIILNSL